MQPAEFLALLFGSHRTGNLAITYASYATPGHAERSPTERKLVIAATELFPLEAVEAAGEAAARHAAGREDVFFGLALVDSLSGWRTKSRDAIGLPGFWIDIDIAHSSHAHAQLPPTERDALSLWDEDPVELRPTFVVHSGHGLHAYCVFENPWELDGDHARRAAKELVKRYQAIYRARAVLRGWHGVDAVHDLSRILRVAGDGMWNFKSAEDPRPVALYLGGGAFHRLADWQVRLGFASGPVSMDIGAGPASPASPAGLASPPAGLAGPPAAPAAVQTPSETVQPRELLPHGTSLLDYVARQMRLTKEPDKQAAVELLLKGQPLEPGTRNTTCYLLASMAAWWALHAKPDVTADDLWPLFAPTVAAMAAASSNPDNPPPDEREVYDQLVRAISDAAPTLYEKWRIEDESVAGLRTEAMRRGGASWFQKAIAGRTPEELAKGYSKEDIEAFTAQQGCSVEDFRQRWIVQYRSSYYLYENGQYNQSVTTAELPLATKRWLVAAPISLTTIKADGGTRWKKPDELLSDYGSVAKQVELSNAVSTSRYDARTRTFYERCHVLRDLTPERNPNVENWLNLLTAELDLRECILDWIATITYLDRQSCALYLCGPPSIGKGLLVLGLSHLWERGEPVDWDSITSSRFRDALLMSPLIHIDEGVHTGDGKHTVSTALRKLTGNSSHSIDRKGLPVCSFSGTLRVIISGNNPHILNDRNDHMTASDSEAFAERLRFIEVSPAAAEFLKNLGGPVAVEKWIATNAIAKHALWLRDQRGERVRARGERFLVAGATSKVHRSLVTSSGISGSICDFLQSYVTRPNLVDNQVGRAIIYGNGVLLVSAKVVCTFWRHYVNYDREPSTTIVGRALNTMSTSKTESRKSSADRTPYYNVKVDLLYEWMEDNAIGDVDTVKERIEHPTDAWKIDDKGVLVFAAEGTKP